MTELNLKNLNSRKKTEKKTENIILLSSFDLLRFFIEKKIIKKEILNPIIKE